MRPAALVLAALALASCTPSPVLKEGKTVVVKTAGLPITGTVYGHGPTAVLLASQGGTSESEWAFFAREVGAAGFTVLTISSPDSQGDSVVLYGQALDFLWNQGFRSIIAGGASNGASGAAYNVAKPGVKALFLVTYHASADLSRSDVPKFFVAGEHADPWRSMAEAGFAKAAGPKDLRLVPGTTATGPSMLAVDPGVHDAAVEFLRTVGSAR